MANQRRLTLTDLIAIEPRIQLLLNAAKTASGPWDLAWAGGLGSDRRGLARRVAKLVGRHRKDAGDPVLCSALAYELVCDAVLAALWARHDAQATAGGAR